MTPIRLPLRTVNPLNRREHWAPRAKRYKQERTLAYSSTSHIQWASLAAIFSLHKNNPIVVKLTRIAPRKMDDDGLAASFKAIRDGVADRLGINDGSELIKFQYFQRQEPKTYAVEIEFP